MSELSAVVRFLNLTASVLLVGIFGFALLIARPAHLGTLPDVKTNFLCFVRLQLRVARWCLVAIFASALLGLWFQTLYVGDPATGNSTGLGAALPMLIETQFGRVWLLRFALLIVLASLIGWTIRFRPGSSVILFVAGFTLSALLLAASALSGHASAADGSRFALQVSADILHLLACGLWLGGLWPLVALLGTCRRLGDPSAFMVATAATQSFSRLALGSVAVLLATGSYNAWNLVGGIAPLVGTPYGKLLLVKLGLLLPLLGLGAMNLVALKPRIVDACAFRSSETAVHLERLIRNVRMEIALGIVILLIVGHMGLMPPARHIQPVWPFPFRWDWNLLNRAPDVHSQLQHAIFWFSIGVAALSYAATRKRMWVLAGLAGLVLWIYVGIAMLVSVSVDAYPTTYKRPSVPYQAISVVNGKSLYAKSGCPVCHGSSGYGDGPNADELRPRPADLTAPHASTHTAGDLFWWISYGVKQSAMPGFSATLGEEDRWDLVNFLRALSDSERARNLEPVIADEPWLIAPDFTYGTALLETKTLRDYRANKIVLLVLPGSLDANTRLKQLAAALPHLQSAGVEVIVVPNSIDYPAKNYPGLIVTEGQREITETYTLFARSFLDENLLATAPHVEFLIDKQGYIRGRWIASEGDAWKSLDGLLSRVQFLSNEKPRLPAPDWHIH